MFQASKCRRHYKSNLGRKRGWFKKGNSIRGTIRDSNLQNIGNANVEPSGSGFQRLSSEDAQEVAYANITAAPETTVPFKLRPTAPGDEGETVSRNEASSGSDENIIVSLKKLSELCESFSGHSCNRPRTDVKVTQRLGLCVSVAAICHNCGFKSEPVNMTEKVRTSAQGPPAGALNEALVVPVLKSKMGLDDVLLVMACLNVKAPSKRVLQRKVNQAADTAEELNEEQMEENQSYVARIGKLTGRGNTVDVEYDTSFPTRPQAGCEASEQSFAPIIEHNTSKKLVISIATANKLCNLQNCDHQSCKKNFRADSSIASSERKLLHDNLQRIRRSGKLKVRSVTSDASAQIAKALRDYNSLHNESIKHYKCFVHKLRNLQKKMKAKPLRTCPKRFDKTVYLQKLSSCIRARVRLELVRLRNVCCTDSQFIIKSKVAIGNIMKCFGGCHSKCRETSLVCISHLSSYSASFLPYGIHIELKSEDINRIQNELNTCFGTTDLQSICKIYSTNMCESVHAKVFSYAPKSTSWARNFTGLCHSATHSLSLGSGRATIALAKAIGLQVKIQSPMYQQLIKNDKTRKYHAKRKKTKEYKHSRYLSKKRKSNRKQLECSLYSSEASSSQASSEHNYSHSCGRR